MKYAGLKEMSQRILELIALGYSNKEISGKLYISIHTVKAYIGIIYEELGVNNRAYAVYKAIKKDIIDINLTREAEDKK